MTEKKKEQQKRFLHTIIGNGLSFTIDYSVLVRQKGILGFFKKKVLEKRKEELVIKEPTLAVLDRVSEIIVGLDLSSVDKKDSDFSIEGYKLANKHSRDIARAVAILVLGEEYYAVKGGNDKEIERLTEIVFRSMKPSQIAEVALYVNTASNLVDFVSSMRLMKMSVTTTPTRRIE